MQSQDDRKSAVKKLKNLVYNSKISVEKFRKNFDTTFTTVFLPNNVECVDYRYGNVSCDVLVPELYASNRVMLYIHGGCFSGGSPKAYGNFCASLATKGFCRVVIPNFRLAPAYPYPAAIEDIQSVFKSLFTEEQVACSLNSEKGSKTAIPEIIIAADGSGASIACSLLFNLRDKYRSCIKNIIFFSPWLNLSQDSKLLTSRKFSDEIISGDVLKKSGSDYTYTANRNSPFVSPIFADKEQLANFPPVYIQMGEKEILLEDAKIFKQKLEDEGNICELDVWEDMMFMFQMADEFLYESHLALDKIGKLITDAVSDKASVQIENKPKLEHSLHADA